MCCTNDAQDIFIDLTANVGTISYRNGCAGLLKYSPRALSLLAKLRSKMSDEALAEEVKELVTRYIHSVTQLEALLFFHERPGQRWDAESLARRLYAGKRETAEALAFLCRDGFLRNESGCYSFAPRHELSSAVDLLARAYSRHLVPITHIIHSKPVSAAGCDRPRQSGPRF